MLSRVVSRVRKRLNNTLNTLKVDNRKNCWQNLLKLHNERNLQYLSEFDKINYNEVTDERFINQCVLKVTQIANSCTIEDIAYIFPDSVIITIDKCRTNKSKTAFVGFESERQCIQAFIDGHQLEIKSIKIVVTFADIVFERKAIDKSDVKFESN